MTTTTKEPAHGLGKLMLAKHQKGECGCLCPYCKQGDEKGQATALASWVSRPGLDIDVSQAVTFEIMPRNPKATGLDFQAGVYSPREGGHKLIAEVYQTVYASHIADALTLLASPLFRGIQTNYQIGQDDDSGRAYHILCDPVDIESGKPFVSGWVPLGGLARIIHEAAEFIRHQVDPNIDRYRQQIMQDHGLMGE